MHCVLKFASMINFKKIHKIKARFLSRNSKHKQHKRYRGFALHRGMISSASAWEILIGVVKAIKFIQIAFEDAMLCCTIMRTRV